MIDYPKPLSQKLGVKEELGTLVINPPQNYPIRSNGKSPLLIQYFATRRKSLEKDFPKLKQQLSLNGSLWISWPKKSSGVETDLNESIIREIGLESGLVDVKVISVDGVWSGLKFVYRLKDR